ncbi:MAG: DUF4380 domain-containing protein [Chloroflexota bacterium]
MNTNPTDIIATQVDVQAQESEYRGWQTLSLNNDLITVQTAPIIGGRIIQFSLQDHEYLWVDDDLAGTQPTSSGLGSDGDTVNYGGEKLWPAPQAWQTGVYAHYCAFQGVPLDDRNPGPPMPDLDGIPHTGALIPGGIRLTSPASQQFGIQFVRDIQIFDASTRVNVVATMTNVDTGPHRWGIWSVAQVNATRPDGSLNTETRTYVPINRNSMFPKGYEQIFGQVGTLQIQPDYESGIMCVHFQNEVAKVGLDNDAGWVATVDGETGYVFVQQFTYQPHQPYPDNASVEVWLHGKGEFYAYDQLIDMGENPPHLIESEILSPFADLEPGETYTYQYDVLATNIGGNFPVLDCTPVGLTAAPLTATVVDQRLQLTGRFGLFYKGQASLAYLNQGGLPIGAADVMQTVTPASPLLLEESNLAIIESVPAEATSVVLQLRDRRGKLIANLAQAQILFLRD